MTTEKINHRIFLAESHEHFTAAQLIIASYVDFLGMDLAFQNFAYEMDNFCAMYGPPLGSMILLEVDGSIVGAVGLRYFSDGICEMKRMYIVPQCQGMGLGKHLISFFIERARALQYKAIRLDTVPRLDKALTLYRKYGFYPIAAYRYNPDPEAIFLELKIM